MAEYETLSLYIDGTTITPYVDIPVEGVDTTFVVDTGCLITEVTEEQVEKWGLTDQLEDAPPYKEVEARFSIGGKIHEVRVLVCDVTANLLG